MEYFDVLDENGKPTGKVKLREDVHRDGDWHRSVDIWIFNSKGQVLLQKRAPNKDSRPNMWDIAAGGHIVAGEDSLTTAVRELEEELGLTVEASKFKQIYRSHKESAILNGGKFLNNSFFDGYMLLVELDADSLVFDLKEISQMRWMDFEDYVKKQAAENPEYLIFSRAFFKNVVAAYRGFFKNA